MHPGDHARRRRAGGRPRRARGGGAPSHRAADIVQEAILRAWHHAPLLDRAGEGIRGWLVTVVRNLAIDSHRARRARPYESDDLDVVEPASPGHEDRATDRLVVREALGELSEPHREILLYTRYLDKSVAETARALGIAPGTVKSRTHAALRALEGALLRRGYAPAAGRRAPTGRRSPSAEGRPHRRRAGETLVQCVAPSRFGAA
ncbi:sigma-70 family RNA polymerase sigma factor, partial [Streptomyces goshikiensis]